MTFEEQVVEKLRKLPVEKQKEVLEFLVSLQDSNGSGTPRRSLRGLWSGLKIDISEEEIAEARREMWSGFPRDIS